MGPNDLQNPFVSPFTSLAGDAGTVTDIYAYGGNDGAVGLAKVVRQVGSCETPSTTTTVAPTTTIATHSSAGDGRCDEADVHRLSSLGSK